MPDDAEHAGVAAQTEPPARTLVDGGALASGQMTKEQFLALLRTQVTAAVEAELGKLGAAAGCPYVDRYFAKYAAEPAAAGEALIRRWIPAARGATSASALIPMVVARVREGVQTWQTARRLPPELIAADPELASAPPTQASTAQAQRLTLDSLEGERGEGERLDAGTAARMSTALGTDVSGARIHSGPAAQAKAAEHDATAFAVGPNVVLGAGAPAAGTLAGDALLAHELAHTAQQKNAAADPSARQQPIGPEDAAAERDASLQGFADRIGGVMRTGLQLQRCPGGGTDPKYEAEKITGPDVGRKIGESHPAKSGWFNHRELTAGDGIGAAATEAEAIALAKMLATDTAILPANGRFYLYKVAGAGDLDLELVYGENAGIKIEPGVLALVNSRGVLWRVQNLGRGTHSASASRQASADPFAPYHELQKSRGLKSLSEPELLATFEAAMFDTALAVLASSEQEARAKQKQLDTAGATGKDEHVEIEATAKDALAIQNKYETVSRTLSTMEGTPADQDTHDHPPGWEDDKARLRAQKAQLALDRKKANARYPMIARYEDASDLEDFLAQNQRGREQALAKDAESVAADCRATRRNIQTGDLNLWEVPSVVAATMAGLGLGKDQRTQIQAKAKAQKTKAAVLSIALAVFSIGFGIAAAVFTGGASLAFTAGALGLGVYDAIKTTEEHFIKNAATNTNTDTTKTLLPAELRQHWGWLVVAWAGVGLDILDAAKAARLMDRIGPEIALVAKGDKTIAQAADALAAGDKKLLDKLRLAAGEAKLTDTLTEAMRPKLSARVGAEITVDGNLGGSVRVMYQIDDTGRTFVTGIRCGPGAKVGDILAHTETVRMLDAYSGLTGRARQLWDRVRSFRGKGKKVHEAPFDVGSKAWESWHELDKLDRLISYRRGLLAEALDKGAPATEVQAQLRKEIKFLENEVDIHQRIVDDLAAHSAGGSGFVAMADDTRAALEAGRRLPDRPDKGADALTADDLKHSAWYFERTPDGSGFTLKLKLDRAGGATVASRIKDPAVLKALTAKVKDPALLEKLLTAAKDDAARLGRLIDQVGTPTRLDELLELTGDAARLEKTLGDAGGIAQLELLMPKVGGWPAIERCAAAFPGGELARVLAQTTHPLGLDVMLRHVDVPSAVARIREWMVKFAKPAAPGKTKTNKLDLFLQRVAEGTDKLAETAPLTAKSILIDSNTAIALIKAADGKPLNPGEAARVAYIKSLPKDTELRIGHVVVGETGKEGTFKGVPITVLRDSKEYQEVLAELAAKTVGTGDGWLDRALIADAFFTRTEPGAPIQLMTSDRQAVKVLAGIAGLDVNALGGYPGLVRRYRATGFDVTVKGRTIRIRPVE